MLHTDIPHDFPGGDIHLGVAGWNIRREHAHRFPSDGTHLARYGAVFNTVEINSCFYRPHRFETYQRWAGSVPEHFRFAVKLPKLITHESRLVGVAPALERFIGETAGLGTKLGPILVQLPPSFAFDASVVSSFFGELRNRFEGAVVLEPRHESWFTNDVAALLIEYQVARVAADPARVPAASEPGGYARVVYVRLHGTPRIYYSAYPAEWLGNVARTIEEKAAQGISTWCIFDNTALGAATSDALAVKSYLLDSQRVTR
ncbi:MAG: DUF72 domain-containing protein [Gemmatimonadota bacterium]|nr:DUF72 domain-containing protein [Gemmatimonadota bacterium]